METYKQILSGGNVHTVEKLPGNMIIKTRHTGNPEGLSMYTVAEDISYEATAIKDAHRIMPDNFPKLIEQGTATMGQIAMREIFPDDAITLKEYFVEQKPNQTLVNQLATLTARYHRRSDNHTLTTGYRDKDFFASLLKYRYLALNLPELQSVVDDLVNDQSRGIIHGGLSPKNILLKKSAQDHLGDKDIAFVDLETACIGSRYFDIGFNLGHIMLHSIDSKVDENDIFDLYTASYEEEAGQPLNHRFLKRVVLATMLYRLLHPETKYELANIDPDAHEVFYEQYKQLSREEEA